MLSKAIEDGIRQYRLVTAERELLEKTLSGSIHMLMEILSLLDPQSFGRAQELRKRVPPIARAFGIESTWEIEIAALLSHIGFVTIPPSVARKSFAGQALSNAERTILSSVPAVGQKLLMNIPRLEAVAKIVYYQHKHFDGSGFPEQGLVGESIPLGARILLVLTDYLQLERNGMTSRAAFEALKRRTGYYDPRVLAVLAEQLKLTSTLPLTRSVTVQIAARELQIGHLLQSNIETQDGLLLLTAGQTITVTTLEKIRNFMSLMRLKEPILVKAPLKIPD